MKDSNFLTYFNNLKNTNSKEIIANNASKIIEAISTKENKESQTEPINKDRYKDYLNVFKSGANNDLLYTTRRLIGGLTSTGTEYSEGFSLTLQLLIEKFDNKINYNELLKSIDKESYVQKSEKNHVKLCALSGKILIYKILLTSKSLNEDNIAYIIKDLMQCAKNKKQLEEGVLVLIKIIFKNIFEDYYSIKKINKLEEEIMKILENYLDKDKQLNKINSSFIYGIYFILMKYIEKFKQIISQKIIDSFFDNKNIKETEQPIFNYFKILLEQPIKPDNKNNKNISNINQLNLSFSLLLEILEYLKNEKYCYSIWNILISPECIKEFNQVSSRNYELLLFLYSIFLINKFFNFKYFTMIFDDSFFISLSKFTSNKRMKFIEELSEVIISKLNNYEQQAKEQEAISEYSLRCLSIFGTEKEMKFPPKALKNFYIFLFSKLNDANKKKYLNDLLKISEDDNLSEIQFSMNSLKLLLNETKLLNSEYKDKVLEYFLIRYYNTDNISLDINSSNFIEQQTMNLIYNLIKPSINEEKKLVPVNSKNSIKILANIHKKFSELIKKDIIDKENLEFDNKFYKKMIQTFTSEKLINDKKSKIISKIGLFTLFLYIRNKEEFEQDVNDLSMILTNNFDKEWMKVFISILLNLLNKGINYLNEFIMNEFKKVSQFLGKDAASVLIEFLGDVKIKKQKIKYTDMDEGAVDNDLNINEDEE